MNEYLNKLSRAPQLPRQTILEPAPDGYYLQLSREGSLSLRVILATPEIEGKISRELAAEFNRNSTKFDRTIDKTYNKTHIGGSALHHNLDGSHTFDGAMQTLRAEYPDEPDWELKLRAIKHLALADFTTPSGINPWLTPLEFRRAKEYLESTVGLSSSLANDFLNHNAAELISGIIGAGSLLFHQDTEEFRGVARQLGRLSSTYFFAGNLLGLMLATAVFVRLAMKQPDNTLTLTKGTVAGAAEIILMVSLLPLPLSVSLILGSTACVFGREIIGGGYRKLPPI